MEKRKRRSAWMRIMAVMLAMVTGITMVPFDTFAAAGKDSGAYLTSSEAVDDELMLNAACDHVHDDCDCDDCAHDDCDCEDHCGESHSCSCDNYEDIGLDGSPEGGVSFSLDYYELGYTSNPMKISIVIYGDNSYSGSVKYSDITAAAYVSKGTSFNMANSVSLDNVQITRGEGNRISIYALMNVYNMEELGISRSDSFVVRAFQKWDGGETYVDCAFQANSLWNSQKNGKSGPPNDYYEGLSTVPAVLQPYIPDAFSGVTHTVEQRDNVWYVIFNGSYNGAYNNELYKIGWHDDNYVNACWGDVRVFSYQSHDMYEGGKSWTVRGVGDVYEYTGISASYSYERSEAENFSIEVGPYTTGSTWSFVAMPLQDAAFTINQYQENAKRYSVSYKRNALDAFTISFGGSCTHTWELSPVLSTATKDVYRCPQCGATRDEETTIATSPTAKTGLIYNANTQTGVEAGTGYTLTGNTARNAGDYTATATLEEGYTWTDGSTDAKEIAWSIAPAELTELLVSETTFLYNGAVQKPEVTKVLAGDITVPPTDYDLAWSNKDSKEVGSYTITATGKNNYTGTATATYTISDGKINLEECKVTGLKEDSSARYTEEEIKNIGLESKDGKKLTEGEDYTKKVQDWFIDGLGGNDDGVIITFDPKGEKNKGKKVVVIKKQKSGTYRLTVNYVYQGGGEAAPTFTNDYKNGSSYYVASPKIAPYTPSKNVVAGSSDNGVPVTETVTYASVVAVCEHNYGRTYLDTGDESKHKVFCDYCMTELPEAEHNKITGPVRDANDNLTGKYVVFCKECGHVFEVVDICNHEDRENRIYVDNKDNKTHTTYCGQCGELMNDVSPHVIEETPLGPVGEGMYQNPGAYMEKCTRCGWQKKHICYHEGQEVYYRPNPGMETRTHRVLCKRCNGVVEPREVCAFGEWLAANEKSHVRACRKCEGYEVADHTPGPRHFYKWEKRYLTYYLYYYQGCLQNCGLHTENKLLFYGGGATFLAPYERFFDMLTSGKISLGEVYRKYESIKMGTFGKGAVGFSLMVPPARLLAWLSYAVNQNLAYSMAYDFMNFEKDITDVRPIETRALYTDAQGRVMEVPIKHKDNADVDPDHSSGPAPLQAGGSVPEYDDTKVEYDFSSMTKEEIESMFFLVDAPALLDQNNTGDHTVLMTVEVTDENGNQLDGIATEYDYRISEITDPDTGEKVKAISDMIPEGLMYDFDKGIAELGIEESDQVIELTGKEAAAAPVPVLKLCPSDGTESAVIPEEQYTLSCRRITVDADGNETALEADRNAITEPGTYRLTATPVEGSEWKGSASVDFRAAYALEGLVTVSGIGDQGYTGAPIEPEVVVTTDMGVELARGGQYVYGKGSDGEDAYVRQEEADYALSYKDNVNAGTASVIVTGTGNYCGTVTKEFTILPADLGDCVMESILPQAYTGKAVKPEVQVYSTRTYGDGKETRTELQNGVDYTTAYADNREPGEASVTLTGMGNYTGTLKGTFTIYEDGSAQADTWNLFEDGSEHVYPVSGITAKTEIKNSNKNSAQYFTAVLSKDKITVALKEGAVRKKAAAANTFDFDLGQEGAVSYTLPFTYNKPVFKLSSAKGTVKKGTEATLKTTVLYQGEDGSFIPYDLSDAVVSYGRQTLEGGADGSLSIRASGKSSDSIRIGMEGWNEQDPVALKYTISETAADKDVLTAELGGLKQVVLNTNAPEQSFTFPLTLNGAPVSADAVSVLKGKKGEENLVSVGEGTLTVGLGRSGISPGSYTVKLKSSGNAAFSLKVKVSNKSFSASGKIKQKQDVVTGQPMVVEPVLKELQGTILGASVSKVSAKSGSMPASDFIAQVRNGRIEIAYQGSGLSAKNLKIGDITLALEVTDGNDGSSPVMVELVLKNVSAKKTVPTVKAAAVVIPKTLAESADGTFVIASANILSTWKDGAKHVQTIAPVGVKLETKKVEAEADPEDPSKLYIKKLTGGSGTIKATLTYPGGVTKTVSIKVSKGK